MNAVYKLTDASPMPYGKHKGETMINIPAPYLIYLFDNDMFPPNPDGRSVKAYILDNMAALKQEAAKARR